MHFLLIKISKFSDSFLCKQRGREYLFRKTPNMNVLELHNISKSFNKIRILEDVNLAIKPSQTVCLIGPSGCGKSTLLYISSGILTPDSGKVMVSEKQIAKENEILKARRENFGFIYQFHNLIPELTGLENIMISQKISKKIDTEFAKFLLSELKIYAKKDQKPGTLSGGEAQRFAIARAFASKPGIIFADEPTGNLDPETAEKTMNLILKLSKVNQTALLLVSHNYDFAKQLDTCFEIKNHKLSNSLPPNLAICKDFRDHLV